MPSDTPPQSLAPVLLMRVSGNTLAMRQRDVVEVLPLPRLAPLPEAPPIVLGAFHLGGEIVLVLPLATLLGLHGPAEGNPLYHHLLLLPEQPGRPRLALQVDRATDILAADPTLLPPGESFNDCIEGDIRLDGVLVPMLTAERLLTAHEATRLAAFAARGAARDAAAGAPVMTSIRGA
jgi:chemotaxis signal transduction protein